MLLIELIRRIGKRPVLYIGEPERSASIWHLRLFLNGYQCGRQPPLEGDDVLDSLTFWVCARYGVSLGARDWAGHLCEQCGNDGVATFKLFFELLDEYVADRERLGDQGIKARYIEVMKKRNPFAARIAELGN